MKTPAQLYGHPTLDDVPVAGPTDPGILKADCWYRNNVLPATPACVDCGGGAIPNWATSKGLLGEWGVLGAAGDPNVWTTLSADQQAWITSTLATLNNIIYQSTGTTCPQWNTYGAGTGPQGALCFQSWYNANYGVSGASKSLRTDGIFDEDVLCALVMVAQLKQLADFPDPGMKHCQTVWPVKPKKLSTGEMFGIAAAAATVIGGVAYVATHKKSRRRKKR